MTQRGSIRWRLAAGAVAVGAALATMPAATAAAAATPLAADVLCVPQGASVFDCFLQISGGTAPYTAAWSGATFSSPGSGTGRCQPGQRYRITVQVTDAVGTQATDTAAFICRGGPPV
jgi:hypothetical protein